MQMYAESKYVLEETSVFSLLGGGVPYLLTSTQSPATFPSLGGGGGSLPALQALEEEILFFSVQ